MKRQFIILEKISPSNPISIGSEIGGPRLGLHDSIQEIFEKAQGLEITKETHSFVFVEIDQKDLHYPGDKPGLKKDAIAKVLDIKPISSVIRQEKMELVS